MLEIYLTNTKVEKNLTCNPSANHASMERDTGGHYTMIAHENHTNNSRYLLTAGELALYSIFQRVIFEN